MITTLKKKTKKSKSKINKILNDFENIIKKTKNEELDELMDKEKDLNDKILQLEKKEAILSDKEKNQLCVFDEDFILKNIKLKDNGLDTIVMLGKSVELSNKIDDATSKKDEIKNKYDEAKEIHEKQ